MQQYAVSLRLGGFHNYGLLYRHLTTELRGSYDDPLWIVRTNLSSQELEADLSRFMHDSDSVAIL